MAPIDQLPGQFRRAGNRPELPDLQRTFQCLESGPIVPIAPAVLAEVRALVAQYEQERDRREAKAREIDREYRAHHNRIRRAMAE